MNELEWAAGLTEGEGCWTRQLHLQRKQPAYPRFKLSMVNEDVIAHFAGVVKRSYRKEYTPSQRAMGHKPAFLVAAVGKPARRLAMLLSPWLGMRRLARMGELGLQCAAQQQRGLPWLAGLLEGEGCFTTKTKKSPNAPLISLQTTDRDTAFNAHALMPGATNPKQRKRSNPRWRDVWTVRIFGKPAIACMQAILSFMGARRSHAIQTILDNYGT